MATGTTAQMGVGKGTKQNLAHSKFSVNRPQELEDGFYASVRLVRPGQASSNDSIFEMSNLQREMSYRMTPETSTPTELKPSSSIFASRHRSLRNLNPAAAAAAAAAVAAEDGTALKHHLEQVFIKPPLTKGD